MVQNVNENVRNMGGTKTIIILSRFLESVSFGVRISFFNFIETLEWFKNFVSSRIQAYSKIAMQIKPRQVMIHSIKALVLPPDFGVVLDAEFKVLTMQRNRVRSTPNLPGIASLGTRKLICE